MNDYPDLHLQQSRLVTLLLLLGAIGFTVGSFYLLKAHNPSGAVGFDQVMLVVAITFFGVWGIPVLTVQLIRKPQLHVNKTGISVTTAPYKQRQVAWEDIQSIDIWTSRHKKIVRITCVPGTEKQHIYISMFPGYSVNQLAETLAEYWEHYRRM